MRIPKLIIALVGVVAGVTVVAAGPGGVQPASAAPTTALVKCQSMQSETDSVSAPILVSGCNRPRVTGGSGTSFAIGPAPFPLTWSTGKQTNYNCGGTPTPDCGGPPSGFPKPGRCAAPLIEFDFVGTIATTFGPWTKRFIGDTLVFDVCLTPSFGTEGLVPGTRFEILKP